KVEYLLKKAEVNKRIGKFDEALKNIDAYILFKSNDLNGYIVRASINESTGNIAELCKDIEKILSLDANNAYKDILGELYLKQNKTDEALKYYTKLINVAPENKIYYCKRGICYLSLKDYQNAFKDFSKAVAIDEQYLDALYNRANTLIVLKMYKEALNDFEKLTKLVPSISEYWLRMSETEYKLSEIDLAGKYYKEAKKHNNELPDFEDYFSNFRKD
ncbi:MAG: TPR protein, partial [uncultured bacterium]